MYLKLCCLELSLEEFPEEGFDVLLLKASDQDSKALLPTIVGTYDWDITRRQAELGHQVGMLLMRYLHSVRPAIDQISGLQDGLLVQSIPDIVSESR